MRHVKIPWCARARARVCVCVYRRARLATSTQSTNLSCGLETPPNSHPPGRSRPRVGDALTIPSLSLSLLPCVPLSFSLSSFPSLTVVPSVSFLGIDIIFREHFSATGLRNADRERRCHAARRSVLVTGAIKSADNPTMRKMHGATRDRVYCGSVNGRYPMRGYAHKSIAYHRTSRAGSAISQLVQVRR
jgi:hypothetical protein